MDGQQQGSSGGCDGLEKPPLGPRCAQNPRH